MLSVLPNTSKSGTGGNPPGPSPTDDEDFKSYLFDPADHHDPALDLLAHLSPLVNVPADQSPAMNMHPRGLTRQDIFCSMKRLMFPSCRAPDFNLDDLCLVGRSWVGVGQVRSLWGSMAGSGPG